MTTLEKLLLELALNVLACIILFTMWNVRVINIPCWKFVAGWTGACFLIRLSFKLCGCLVLLLLVGCTTLRIEQRDESPDERIITTTITGSAWFSSSQAITKLKALQTDKTQSFGTDSIGQHGATNSLEALKHIVRILELLHPAP